MVLTPEAIDKLKGKTILVVDDENELREVVSTLFKRAGCTILEAENGILARNQIEKTNVDIVITDVRMSGGDGVELLEWIKKRTGHQPVVILVTGFADISESEALSRGAKAVLAKPFRLQTIVTTVTEAMG
ncbi:MAG: response regulator [Bdellovibrionales bacterium]|nr:response regulator [Bdellovibrionales bacterium]